MENNMDDLCAVYEDTVQLSKDVGEKVFDRLIMELESYRAYYASYDDRIRLLSELANA